MGRVWTPGAGGLAAGQNGPEAPCSRQCRSGQNAPSLTAGLTAAHGGDVWLQVEPGSTADEFIVKGRGMLHLGILIENMRREGYEFQARLPLFRSAHGITHRGVRITCSIFTIWCLRRPPDSLLQSVYVLFAPTCRGIPALCLS